MGPFNPDFAVRRWLKVALVVVGIGSGALFGLALTVFGKIVTGAPPAAAANYLWNAAVFGVLAGIVSPLVSWSALRRVPLWRTVAEPLALALAGGAAGVLLGSEVLFLALPPAGLILAFVRLSRAYPQEPSLDDPVQAERIAARSASDHQ